MAGQMFMRVDEVAEELGVPLWRTDLRCELCLLLQSRRL